MLKVDQVHVLRRKVLVGGRSRRQVAKELGISRLTGSKYLTGAVAIRRETKPRARRVRDKVGGPLEALLAAAGAWTGGKQQLTATRLHELLVADGHRVGVTLVKQAVAEWRRQRRGGFFAPADPAGGPWGEGLFGRLLRLPRDPPEGRPLLGRVCLPGPPH